MAIFDWINDKLTLGERDARHPLGSEAGIEEFQASLPQSNPVVSLDMALEGLEAAQAAKLSQGPMRRALRALDKGLQREVGELSHVLLRDARGDQVSEAALAALLRYCQRMGALYRHAMDQLPVGGQAGKDTQEYAAVFSIRAMRILVMQKKLLHVGYRAIPGECWEAMNAVYARSRVLGVQRSELEPYAGLSDKTSVQQDFLVGLLFSMAPYGNLLPTQMLCLDALLRRGATGIGWGDQPSENLPFCYDITRNQAPYRWLEGLGARTNMRFFGPGKIHPMVEGLLNASASAAEIPDWAVPSGCDMLRYRDLLERVALHWSKKPPERRHRRNSAADEVLVVNSFAQTRRMVAASEYARSQESFTGYEGSEMRDNKYFNRIRFDSVKADKTQTGKLMKNLPKISPQEMLEKLELKGDRELMQRWKVQDVSESGMGAIVPGRAPWARLGMFVGVRESESLIWRLAVIRRMGRTSDNKVSMGLEWISGEALSGRVLPIPDAEPASWQEIGVGGEGSVDAIFVIGPSSFLVVPPGRYAEGDHFLVWARQTRYPVRITAVMPPGVDYQLLTAMRMTGD